MTAIATAAPHPAIAEARHHCPTLAATSLADRMEALQAVLDYLGRRREWLLDCIVAESGRSRGDAMISDIFQLTEDLLWLRGNAARALADEKVPTPLALLGKRCHIQHEARGVVLVISPWNLPLAIGLTAAMFAFIAGNAVILKPSEHTPMHEALAEIRALHPLLDAGFQVIHGDGRVAESLIAGRPDLVVFTGSVATGKKILAQCAPMLVPVVMELGAKDAMLVFDDADLERAAAAACWGNLHNSGQSCTAVERLFVHNKVRDEFSRQLLAAGDRIRCGTGPDHDLGQITTDFQLRHIEALVEDARSKGARVLSGGKSHPDNRRIYLPTLLTGVTDDMRITQEEIFGPVMCLYGFDHEHEVVAQHNSSPFGLSTSIWTKDGQRAARLARQLETGCININNIMLTEGNAHLPFGGVKHSGFGRMKGVEGLRGMTRSKAVLDDPGRMASEPNWYPYSTQKLSLMGRLLDLATRRDPLRFLGMAQVGLAINGLLRSRSR